MELIGEKISMKIKNRVLFEDVSLSVASGTSLALVGLSGSGKTTLLNCLGLIQKPTSGKIIIGGHTYGNHTKKDTLAFWRTSAAFIYQDSGVIDEESILYNITLKRGRLSPKNTTEAATALKEVGLSGREKEKAAVLSGGEKQRLGLARAIYKKASVLFADEPTASLDAHNKLMVQDLLFKRVALGATVILATHDLALAKSCNNMLDVGAYQGRHHS